LEKTIGVGIEPTHAEAKEWVHICNILTFEDQSLTGSEKDHDLAFMQS